MTSIGKLKENTKTYIKFVSHYWNCFMKQVDNYRVFSTTTYSYVFICSGLRIKTKNVW